MSSSTAPPVSMTTSSMSPSSTTSRSSTNGLGNNISTNVMTGSGAGIWYGGVALALLVACLATIGSRYMIRRRRRARFVNSERADATRRGEEGELPTYGETTMASRDSTLPYPPMARTTLTGSGADVNWSSISRPVPPSHPMYAPTAPRPARSDLERGPEGGDSTGESVTLPPPDYDGPPKYA